PKRRAMREAERNNGSSVVSFFEFVRQSSPVRPGQALENSALQLISGSVRAGVSRRGGQPSPGSSGGSGGSDAGWLVCGTRGTLTRPGGRSLMSSGRTPTAYIWTIL